MFKGALFDEFRRGGDSELHWQVEPRTNKNMTLREPDCMSKENIWVMLPVTKQRTSQTDPEASGRSINRRFMFYSNIARLDWQNWICGVTTHFFGRIFAGQFWWKKCVRQPSPANASKPQNTYSMFRRHSDTEQNVDRFITTLKWGSWPTVHIFKTSKS